VRADEPLKSYGIDSLMGLELRNRLEAVLGMRLSATLVWAHPTVAKIADFLASQLELQRVESAPQDGATEDAEGAASTAESRAALMQQLARELETP
jgi:myxalamid-type polyketide synthase MxaF